jgi:hypothetical protein
MKRVFIVRYQREGRERPARRVFFRMRDADRYARNLRRGSPDLSPVEWMTWEVFELRRMSGYRWPDTEEET